MTTNEKSRADELTEAEIDAIADDGHRNAMGGIYVCPAHDFASAVIVAHEEKRATILTSSPVEQPAAAPLVREVQGLAPWEPGALAVSIAEIDALSNSEDRGLSNSETESMMAVVYELRRLQALERAAAPFDPAAQYDERGVHIGSGLPKESCPCGLCETMRAAASQPTAAMTDERAACAPQTFSGFEALNAGFRAGLARAGADGATVGEYDLNTSDGGRGYIAEFFSKRLRRHDFGRYIRELLAADFACALARYLSDQDASRAPAMAAEAAAPSLRAEFDDAYRAFVGAFDTPQMRRAVAGEYADDARRRLRTFAERFAAPQPPAQADAREAVTDEPAAWLVDGLNGHNERHASVWIRKENADAVVATLFNVSIEPLDRRTALSTRAAGLTDDEWKAIRTLKGYVEDRAGHIARESALDLALDCVARLLAAHPVQPESVTFDVSVATMKESHRTTYHVLAKRSDRSQTDLLDSTGVMDVFHSENREHAEIECAAWDAFLTGAVARKHLEFVVASVAQPELHEQVTEADFDRLKRFVGLVLKDHRNHGHPGDVDGGTLQAYAARCGLIEERRMEVPCSENCSCAEFGEFPTTCFFNTDLGTAVIDVARMGEGR
ncbi:MULTISPECIES: hypothetical protein [unclassified Burkholderia]|uniref:hypothetical protein n=1 Tax=unclassified Burkholderia TaxID=2613784 RepID=UPI002AB0DE81|nr:MULTISPECIES: hypothetical protein [unclassified Burkholderia]